MMSPRNNGNGVVKVKATKSYYLTEVSIELPTSVEDIDALAKELRANGKMVVLYSGGGTQGINLEQRTHIPAAVDDQIRNLLNLGTKNF